MAPNKTKPTEFSVNGFIAQLPDPLQRAGGDALLAKLGKYSTGNACLHIKKPTGVDAAVLNELTIPAVAAMRARHPNRSKSTGSPRVV